MTTFWLVWCEEHGPPMHKHSSRFLAEKEAERLARKYPGARFVVLGAVGSVVKDDVHWERVPNNDEIPF